MFGLRSKRAEDAFASLGADNRASNAHFSLRKSTIDDNELSSSAIVPTHTSIKVKSNYVLPPVSSDTEVMQERLQRLEDEDQWSSSHTMMVIKYNGSSLSFWILCAASMCFAILNGYHGYVSAGGVAAGDAPIIIGLLYWTIELTVPMSAHLVSWGSKGQSRWGIRVMGTVAYGLGVCFSLLILQAHFSSGASTTAVKAKTAETLLGSDTAQLERARATVDELRKRVGTNSSASLQAKMDKLLATPISRKETLGQATRECAGVKENKQQKRLCEDYQTLSVLQADAVTLEKADLTVDKATGNLAVEARFDGIGHDAQDRVFSTVIGTSLENVQLFKASFIALMAALLTHILWIAHGALVNTAIVRKRDAMFEKNMLARALDRDRTRRETAAEREEAARASELARIAAETKAAKERSEAEAARITAETQAAFMAQQTGHKIALAVASAPLREQPTVIQLQRFFSERAVQAPELAMQIGIFHDDYNRWSNQNGIVPVTVDRFVQLVKEIGMSVSSDGRIVGAAIKTR